MSYENGSPWSQQYDFNTTQPNADLSDWAYYGDTPATAPFSQAVVTNNKIFLLGGSGSANIQTCDINLDGSLGAWSTIVDALPEAAGYSALAQIGSKLYLMGGWVGSTYGTQVWSCDIDFDGSLGSWEIGTPLPTTFFKSMACVTTDRLYLIGGVIGGSYSNKMYSCIINEDGTLGTWSLDSSTLPVNSSLASYAKIGDKLYHIAGQYSGSSVYESTIAPDGTLGAWSLSSTMPGSLYSSQVVVVENTLYVIGGQGSSAVYSCEITSGVLGTWTTRTSLPTTITDSTSVIVNNSIYTIAGTVGGSYSTKIYKATFAGGLNDYTGYAGTAPLETLLLDVSLNTFSEVFSMEDDGSGMDVILTTFAKISSTVITQQTINVDINVTQPKIISKSGESCSLTIKKPIIESKAITTQIGSGEIKAKKSRIVSSLYMEPVYHNSFKTKVPCIKASMASINLGITKLSLKKPVLVGNLLATNNINMSCKVNAPIISGRFLQAYDYNIIKYSINR